MTTPTLICDDVLHWAATYDGPKCHALCADPPYSLKFMNSAWDDDIAFRPDTWRALAQHLLPGAFGACFAAARGWHRLACAIEDAGLIIHPSIFMLGWAQGSGFPKATRIDTQLDKAAGLQRCTPYQDRRNGPNTRPSTKGDKYSTGYTNDVAASAPATPLAAAWAGHRYGLQALKPALEPIILWQVPYEKRPVDSITTYGAGALWVDGSRIKSGDQTLTADASVYTNGSFRDIQGSDERGADAQHALVCTLRKVGDILRCRSIADTCQEHNVGGQDDRGLATGACALLHARLYPNGAWCDLTWSEALSSQVDCLPCRRFCDAHLQRTQEAAQVSAPSLADALAHMCSDLQEPSHSPWKCSVHLSNLDGPVLQVFWSFAQLLCGNYIDTIIPYREPPKQQETAGRWPPNFVMIHLPTCVPLPPQPVPPLGDAHGVFTSPNGHRWQVGTQATPPPVQAWHCAPECPVFRLDAQAGERSVTGKRSVQSQHAVVEGTTWGTNNHRSTEYPNDAGNASRFFPTFWADAVAAQLAAADPVRYCAKSSRRERDSGLEGMPLGESGAPMNSRCAHCGRLKLHYDHCRCQCSVHVPLQQTSRGSRNPHPCVKPLALCRWLATLLLPPAAYAPRRLLVPFAGSGSEMLGAALAGWEEVIGIEKDPLYVAISVARLAHHLGLCAKGRP
jgi:hypothetical protein